MPWREDAKRLKQWLGAQHSIEYHKILNTRVDANTAQQIREGYLVVSASEWVHHEWDWLRASHQPIVRIGCTLSMCQMGN